MNTILKEHVVAEYKVGLLGASFDTGNLGVSALAESIIKVILNRWPIAEVTLLDSGGVIGERRQRIGNTDVCINEVPIRFCKNIFLKNHFVVLCFSALHPHAGWQFQVQHWRGQTLMMKEGCFIVVSQLPGLVLLPLHHWQCLQSVDISSCRAESK